jgi:hypothetical protein
MREQATFHTFGGGCASLFLVLRPLPTPPNPPPSGFTHQVVLSSTLVLLSGARCDSIPTAMPFDCLHCTHTPTLRRKRRPRATKRETRSMTLPSEPSALALSTPGLPLVRLPGAGQALRCLLGFWDNQAARTTSRWPLGHPSGRETWVANSLAEGAALFRPSRYVPSGLGHPCKFVSGQNWFVSGQPKTRETNFIAAIHLPISTCESSFPGPPTRPFKGRYFGRGLT